VLHTWGSAMTQSLCPHDRVGRRHCARRKPMDLVVSDLPASGARAWQAVRTAVPCHRACNSPWKWALNIP
jgi:hypothetical protein